MQTLFVLAAVTCLACVVVGLMVPALRPMAISGGAALIFLVCAIGWWALIYSGAFPDLLHGPFSALLFFLPPLVPVGAFLYVLKIRGGHA